MTPEEFKEWYAKEKGYNSWPLLRHELWIEQFYKAESECMQDYAEYYHKEMVKEEILPDIRNKLSPVSNLCAMILQGEDCTSDFVITEIQNCLNSVEILTQQTKEQ